MRGPLTVHGCLGVAFVVVVLGVGEGGFGFAEAGAVVAPTSGAAQESELRFLRDGKLVKRIDRDELRASCGAREVEIDDPYYGRRKRFLACPLAEVMRLGFGADGVQVAAGSEPRAAADGAEAGSDADVLLRARDGYEKPTTRARLAEPGGFLAFADAAHMDGADPNWEPIDRRRVDPGPYYIVWADPQRQDVHRYPWPYQLVEIELTSFAARYPHTRPRTAKRGAPAWTGFEIFRGECISCHAMNGEGGKIGPDLNVPRSIVEYRPVPQVKAYIRDPTAFRYTSMPAHPHLSPGQLDALIAYFETMKTLKHDPGRGE